jgi:hypothetical protein
MTARAATGRRAPPRSMRRLARRVHSRARLLLRPGDRRSPATALCRWTETRPACRRSRGRALSPRPRASTGTFPRSVTDGASASRVDPNERTTLRRTGEPMAPSDLLSALLDLVRAAACEGSAKRSTGATRRQPDLRLPLSTGERSPTRSACTRPPSIECAARDASPASTWVTSGGSTSRPSSHPFGRRVRVPSTHLAPIRTRTRDHAARSDRATPSNRPGAGL